MARATDRAPFFQIVDSGGALLLGPYPVAESSGAPDALGLHLESVEPWEEDICAGPWVNYAYQQMSMSFGYRLHATFKFVAVESAPASPYYGIALLHLLWKTGREKQVSYAGLQLKMFASSPFRPVIVTSGEWHPVNTANKQGYYDVTFDIATRDLIATPGEWADSQW